MVKCHRPLKLLQVIKSLGDLQEKQTVESVPLCINLQIEPESPLMITLISPTNSVMKSDPVSFDLCTFYGIFLLNVAINKWQVSAQMPAFGNRWFSGRLGIFLSPNISNLGQNLLFYSCFPSFSAISSLILLFSLTKGGKWRGA